MTGQLILRHPRILVLAIALGIAVAATLVIWQVTSAPVTVPDPVYSPSRAFYPKSASVEGIVNQADIVFIGRVTSVGDLINGARVESNPSQPDPNIFLPSREYHVTVETDISDSSPDTLVVVHPEGGHWKLGGEQTLEEWKAARPVRPGYTTLEVDSTYTFLLSQLEFYGENRWKGAAEPYRFKHMRDGRAFPEGTYSDAGEGFHIPTQLDLKSQLTEHLASK